MFPNDTEQNIVIILRANGRRGEGSLWETGVQEEHTISDTPENTGVIKHRSYRVRFRLNIHNASENLKESKNGVSSPPRLSIAAD